MARAVAVDLLTGFVALGVIMTGFVTGVLGENLRAQVVTVSVLFLAAGLLRGPGGAEGWLKGLTISLGAAVPVLCMAAARFAFSSKPHLLFFIAASVAGSVAGVYARRLWRTARTGAGVALATGWVLVALLIAQLLVPRVLEAISGRHVNRPAPAFSFTAADGAPVTNESLRGKVTVLAFWASWCPPCRKELPRIEAIAARYGKTRDVAFFAVNTEHEDEIGKAASVLRKMGLTLPVVSAEDSAKNFGIEGLPTLMITDRTGRIRLVHVGYDGAEDLDGMVSREIAKLLRSSS